ncbi:hypothetical protein OIU84_009842 [Salix udensis]|uniref:Uncharacterized protein n=1 Tax=Salix udensis TaxID=889485 RepID=A0AAD6NVE3_9ROSI|nr:hypothetical protein OIU84_009842 [Salix udensis]
MTVARKNELENSHSGRLHRQSSELLHPDGSWNCTLLTFLIAKVPLPAAFSVKRGLQRSCFPARLIDSNVILFVPEKVVDSTFLPIKRNVALRDAKKSKKIAHFLHHAHDNQDMTALGISCSIFYLSLISQGHCQCHPATDLKIFQSETEVVVQNKPQWKVTIVNDCVCTQVNIKLACDGFQTVEEVDSSILAIGDDGCYVNHEQPVYGHQTFNFTYSWGTQYPFMPIYSESACS